MSRANLFALAVFVTVFSTGLLLNAALQVMRARPAALMRARLFALDAAAATAGDDAGVATLFHEQTRRLRFWTWLDDRLRRIEIVGGKFGPRLAGVVAAAAIAVAIGIARIDVVPAWAGPVLLAVLPLAALRAFYKMLIERFRLRMLGVFPDALDLMVRAVRAGVPVVRAIEIVADECAQPLAAEFRRIADGLQLGIELETVLNEAMRRLRIPEFSFFCVALLLQRETGGSLGETLEGLADIVRGRKEVRQKTRALTAESRLASRVIACVPPVVLGALYTINRDYAQVLISTHAGHMILVASGVLLVSGLVIIQRIAKLDT